MDRGAGAGGQRVPATGSLPGHMLAAPSVPMARSLTPTLSRRNVGTRGRLRVSPGPLPCFPCPPAHAPRTNTVGAPLLRARSRSRVRSFTRSPRDRSLQHGRPSTRRHTGTDQRGRDDVCSGERGADERGSSGRTQGSRADAPSSLRCEDTGSARATCPSGQMGRRARALGGPASQGPSSRRPPPRPRPPSPALSDRAQASEPRALRTRQASQAPALRDLRPSPQTSPRKNSRFTPAHGPSCGGCVTVRASTDQQHAGPQP